MEETPTTASSSNITVGADTNDKAATHTTTTTTTHTTTTTTTPTIVGSAAVTSPTNNDDAATTKNLSYTIATGTPVIKRAKSARPSPYPTKPNSILLSAERRSRQRKSLSWLSDDKMTQVRYFEHIPDERTNVYNAGKGLNENVAANASSNAHGGSPSLAKANNKSPHLAAGGKISSASSDPISRSPFEKRDTARVIEYSPWRPPILIDFSPELPSPGWLSTERSAQAERETYVLGAIDLPGQPSTIDEPDQPKTTETSEQTKEGSVNEPKVIPLENSEGMYREYPDMYASDIVNGVRTSSASTDNNVTATSTTQSVVSNLAPFCNQQQQGQLIQQQQQQNQFRQQLAHATQSAFNFQDMGVHAFQQQAQMPLSYPFQQQAVPQPQQQFHQQQQIMPFANQQPQQQLPQQQLQSPFVDQPTTGPIMPWLSYPFNQVSENSHAHLFRRPTT